MKKMIRFIIAQMIVSALTCSVFADGLVPNISADGVSSKTGDEMGRYLGLCLALMIISAGIIIAMVIINHKKK